MTPQVLLVFMTRFEECKPMLGGITQYTRSHRPWDAFLDDQGRAEVDPQWLRRRRWQGVISRHTTVGLVRECADLGIPLVDLNDIPPFPGVPKIRPDNVAMGHLGGEHFLERGFTHYAFTGFRNNEWSCERRDGFVEAVRLAGHAVEVYDADYPGDLDPTWDLVQTRQLARWLKKLPKPVCIMACNDLRALQVIHAAQTMKLPVPEEVAVLGCNNDEARCDLAYPPLSSVASNAHRSGYVAAELLDGLMRGGPPSPVDLRIEPAGVVTRRSSDILAIGDRNVAGAIAFIRERACSGIAVDDVLPHVALSRSQLEKRFRAYLGRSPQAEIRRVQVARIRQLLAETDFPLKKIADLTGFEHVEYMCVVFKRITGRSPGSYRIERQSPEKVRPAGPKRRPAVASALAGLLLPALLGLLAFSPPVAMAAPPAAASGPAATAGLFAPENLLAWCIVPYDSVRRPPAERMAMLRRLGFTQYVWDWRQIHLAQLPEEIRAARDAGIRLRGVWLWIDARSDRPDQLGEANRAVVRAVADAGLPAELWVGFNGNVFAEGDDAARVARGVAYVSHLRSLVRPFGGTVCLYNHGNWFGEPENQLRIIAAAGGDGLGIIYNFHHGHAQIDRFDRLLPAMLPHLRCVVLNGMNPAGPKILPIGEGTHEAGMIRLLASSGYRGPIGILGHVDDADVEQVLQRNLQGLRRLTR